VSTKTKTKTKTNKRRKIGHFENCGEEKS